MKSKLLIVLTILVISTAQAEHHIAHTLGHLAEAESETLILQDALAQLQNEMVCNVTITPHNADLSRCEDGFTAVNHAVVSTQEALDVVILAQSSMAQGELDDARRFINQPHKQPYHVVHGTEDGFGVSAARALKRVTEQIARARYAGVRFPDNDAARHLDLELATTRAWAAVDRAIWHRTDAEREEGEPTLDNGR